MRNRQRQIDQECLAHAASINFEAHAPTGDHREAFVETVRKALLEGYQPHAAWVTDTMLASGRPTLAVLPSHPEGSMVFPVIVGGVSAGWADQLLDTPESGRGWRLIEGEISIDQAIEAAIARYRQPKVCYEYYGIDNLVT